MNATRLAAAVTLSVVLVGGCRRDSGSARPDSSTSAANVTPAPGTFCAVADAMIPVLSVAIKGAAGHMPVVRLTHAIAVSDSAVGLFYISALATPTGSGETFVMTWGSTSLQPGAGLMFAVSPGAQAVSDLPPAVGNFHPDYASQAAKVSRKCVMMLTKQMKEA